MTLALLLTLFAQEDLSNQLLTVKRVYVDKMTGDCGLFVDIARGLDVFELAPTKFLTQNEIDAAKTVQVSELNVQDQQKLDWRPTLIVAKAYVDQLERSQALPAKEIADLRKAIQIAQSSHLSKSKLAKLGSMAPSLEQSAATAKSPADSTRLHGLADILKHPSA